MSSLSSFSLRAKATLCIYVCACICVPQLVKNLPAMGETWVQSLGQEDPLEKGMAAHFSILAWRFPWMEEPGRLLSVGSQRDMTERLTALLLLHVYVWNLVCVCNIGSLSPGICPQSLFEKDSYEAVVRFPSSLLSFINPASLGWRHMGAVSTVNLQHKLGLI